MGAILGRLIRWFATDRWGRAIAAVAGDRVVDLVARRGAKTSIEQADKLPIPVVPVSEPIINWETVSRALTARVVALRAHLARRPDDIEAAEVLGMIEVQLAQALSALRARGAK